MYFLLSGCENPDILRIIYFALKILDIIFLLVPIGLIIFLIIDIYKSVISGEEKDIKKNNKIIINRLIFAVLLFFVPTIVGAVVNLLSDVGLAYYTNENDEKITYQQCLDNANLTKIQEQQAKQDEEDKEKEEKIKQELNSRGDFSTDDNNGFGKNDN